MDAQGRSRGATVASSGHIVGPVSSTSCSFGTFIGVGGWGGTTGFGGGFLVPQRWSRLTDRQFLDGCSLETSNRLHDGVYNFGKKKITINNPVRSICYTCRLINYFERDIKRSHTSNIDKINILLNQTPSAVQRLDQDDEVSFE